MIPSHLPRVCLGHYPTPVEALPRLSAMLGGPELSVKRDDLTGLGGGGNKVRKLELLVADAIAKGADTLVTSGAAQSNQVRQAAAAAARTGLAAHVVLVRTVTGDRPQGNWLLDRLLGAEITWAESKEEMHAAAEQLMVELAARGRRPYLVPYGASNALGALGYALAAGELVGLPPFDHIVFASSSGGTQAGLIVGARLSGLRCRMLGISVDQKVADLQATVNELANEAAALAGSTERFSNADIHINSDYIGGGYGVLSAGEREIIGLAARSEGLLLDPVYTARAFAALVDLIRGGAFARHERVLFLHTGGTPAIFAYADQL
jgi:L-cysteate sulfo-lyase